MEWGEHSLSFRYDTKLVWRSTALVVPVFQMFLPFINGLRPYPACVADEKGDVVAVTNVSSAKDLEEFFRIECVRMG